MGKKKKITGDETHRIFATQPGGLESVAELKNWCHIDATYGKISLPKQLKSAAAAYRNSREYAATIMLQEAAEIR